MRTNKHLFYIFAVLLFSLAGIASSIMNYNPFEASANLFIFFYISTFLFLSTTSTLALFFVRYNSAKNQSPTPFLWPSLRQSVLLSLCLTTLLILRGLKILDLLLAISMILVTILLELFFQTKKPKTT